MNVQLTVCHLFFSQGWLERGTKHVVFEICTGYLDIVQA